MSDAPRPPRRRNPADAGLLAALDAARTGKALADAVGVTESRISQWHRVPYLHVLTIERAFGIHRSVIRPDVYPPGDGTGVSEAA